MNDEEKYKILIVNKINYRLKKWGKYKYIYEKEIYIFLNNIIDSANAINLVDLEQLALDKLDYITESSMKEWSKGKWSAFLRDITFYVKQKPHLNNFILSKNQLDDNVILLIDSDHDFISSMKTKLEEKGYHVIVALDAEKGLQVFYTIKPLFVLMDIDLRSGKELYDLKQIMEVAQNVFTPIVLVSGENIEENRIAAYSIGATDFIPKPINFSVFFPYLKNRIEYRERVLESITIDELTRTLNRKQMNYVVNTALSKYRETKRAFTVVMVDIDLFKKVNDEYGHIVGDQVLEKLSFIMKKHKRDDWDLVFRYGGEEFLIYLPDTEAEEAYLLVEKMRQEFNHHMFSSQGSLFHVTFSAGILTVDNNHQSIEEVIDDADKALFQSKESGRNQTTIYSKKSTPIYQKKLNVIIVDDDRLIRTMLKDAFMEWDLAKDINVIVEDYPDGQDFLESSWYQPNEKHLIFLDGVMPKIDGIEVLKQVRKEYPEENIVISMLTSRSDEENVVKALIKGADDYMLKSFNVKEIMARSETLVRRMKLY